MKRRFEPALLKLANYLGFRIEWNTQKALGYRTLIWEGYSGLEFDPFDLIHDEIMSFEVYVAMNDGEMALLAEMNEINIAAGNPAGSVRSMKRPPMFNNLPMPNSLTEKYKL